MTLKKLREYILYFALILLGISVFFTISSLIGIFASADKITILSTINNFLGPWVSWVLVVALIGILFGTWYTYDTIKKRKMFDEYITSESKAKFLKNLRDLEVISAKLGPKYKQYLNDKKKEWRVK